MTTDPIRVRVLTAWLETQRRYMPDDIAAAYETLKADPDQLAKCMEAVLRDVFPEKPAERN